MTAARDQPAGGRTPRAGGRRELAVGVVGHLVGAGLALLAAQQDWAVLVTRRPAPLPPLRETYSGGDLVAWLPAAALVGLAAGIALYATRGWGRRLVAAAAALCGVAIAVGGGYGLAVADDGARSVVGSGLWPALTVVGGLLVTAAAGFTLARGTGWPSMGSRYQRVQPAALVGSRPSTGGDKAAAGGEHEVANGGVGEVVDGEDAVRLWDALDAGSDPTDRP